MTNEVKRLLKDAKFFRRQAAVCGIQITAMKSGNYPKMPFPFEAFESGQFTPESLEGVRAIARVHQLEFAMMTRNALLASAESNEMQAESLKRLAHPSWNAHITIKDPKGEK